MDANYIKPFVASIQNVFSTMLQLTVTVKEPRIKDETTATFDVSGIIGMSGDVSGSVVLSLPSDTAEAVVAIFCGQKLKVGSPDFVDAVGELVNMVSGGAKALFKDKKVSISCPSVVVGPKHTVTRPSDVPCIVIPCQTDCGELVIEVAIRERVKAPADVATSKAAQGAETRV
jgi:chemotaxis protein CheX